jgi:CxxC-x17-CxxC domain-containing protein
MEDKKEKKICQNCKLEFIIEPEDFNFYEKIKVPPPTFCPECRMIRRMSFGNLNKFYKKPCEKCGEDTIGLYPSDRDDRMYCNICWWKDDWDGTEYGMDYDPNRPFLEQLIELRKKSIFVALESLFPSNVNTKYTNNSSYQKNCFMTIYADFDEHCAYTFMTANNKDCLNSYRLIGSELCYEGIGLNKSYGCFWSEELDSCTNCIFCQNCHGCIDCFGCVNLINQKYCIFNKQYSKEEYFKKLTEMKIDTYSEQQKFKKEAEDFWLKFPKREHHGNSLNKNVSGEYIFESKNTHNAYLIKGAEDSRYVQFLSLKGTKDCYDYTGWGSNSSLLYECYIVGEGAYHNKFCSECWPEASNLEYCFYTIQSKDCFGCVNLKGKKYCILNKQYSKEEYFKLKERIIEDMKKNPWVNKAGHIYSYGEFLPPELSPYGYNETIAHEYEPLNKEEAEKLGFNYFNIKEKEYNFTIKDSSLLPETIDKVKDEIQKEIIKCDSCYRGFNFNILEIELLRKMNQPLPHSCPNCRHERRFNRTNKPILYNRNCAQCQKEIQTPYAPDRPEIVYCEECYKREVY